MMKHVHIYPLLLVALAGCTGGSKKPGTDTTSAPAFTGANGEVKLITIDPGHFHASLVQKLMYEQIAPTVHVYAPQGPDVADYLAAIEGFNSRADAPTAWTEKTYYGADFLQKALDEKAGNVVVLAGNNNRKIDYITASVNAGLNVFADKPLVISKEGFDKLEAAFNTATEKGLFLYDIMTERFEITTIIQRELSKIPEVFGKLVDGTPDEPAISKESVHHFYKPVAGKTVKRPAWFFDVTQQGEGIVDVTTHLVDLIQWEAFPEQPLKKSDVEILSARHWPTAVTKEQFTQATQMDAFPDFLKNNVADGALQVYSNGEFIYKLRGKTAKVSVIWNFQAPEGTGDTHYSIMRGSLCELIIKQGAEENYKPAVFIRATINDGLATFEAGLQKAVNQDIANMYPGLKLVKLEDKLWTVDIPDKYKVGHEAHFGEVTKTYLRFLKRGKMPEWEVPNMLVKYYTTTSALEMAKKN
ncbi:MAG: oxidoreductase [Bacteroidales bacterium]|jgi:predicted dehydrogenase|nr:oxidoreductase [Bacteroidales bacterium]